MSHDNNPYEGAINDLVAKIEERMRPILDDKRMVNKLCVIANLPPRYPDVETDATRGSMTIRRDQFHKKPLATAVREFLEQRGSSDRGGLGAATVNEIFDALISGGYQAETDDLENAKRGLRIALTKNFVTFYRIDGGPSGSSYGLLEWYPKAKPQTPGDENKPKRKRGRPRKSEQKQKRGRPPKAKPTGNVVDLTTQKETTAPKEAAASELRKPRAAPHEGQQRGSVQEPPERKEKPDVVHQPDHTGPVKTSEAA
jgi:hypothetical protein